MTLSALGACVNPRIIANALVEKRSLPPIQMRCVRVDV